MPRAIKVKGKPGTGVSPEDERRAVRRACPSSALPESVMTIDGVNVHKSVTADRILAAVKAGSTTLDDPGFRICCGAGALGVEPDARRYECESGV
jgi:hypothetical protein